MDKPVNGRLRAGSGSLAQYPAHVGPESWIP